MIIGLEDRIFYIAFGIPVLIAILLLIWGRIYNPGKEDD